MVDVSTEALKTVKDALSAFQTDINGISLRATEYDKIQEEYFSMFGYNVPRALLPDAMSDEEIISAMKVCIENEKDTLFELLGVELNDEYLY